MVWIQGKYKVAVAIMMYIETTCNEILPILTKKGSGHKRKSG